MLPQEQIKTLAENSGIDADALAKAISDEQEVKIELPKGKFRTEEQEATLLDNHGKTRYDAGISKARKDAFDGKSKEDFLSEFKNTVIEEAKIEPNKKVTDLETSLSKLQKKYEEDIASKDLLLSQKESSLSAIQTASKLRSVAPKFKEGFSFEDAHTLFNVSHEVKEDGVYKDGQLLKNDLQAPITQEEAFVGFVTDRGWNHEAPKGNGGNKGQASNGTPKSYKEFQDVCKSKGWNEGSQEAKEYLNTIRSKNPDFEI